jgi:hypothetical protein
MGCPFHNCFFSTCSTCRSAAERETNNYSEESPALRLAKAKLNLRIAELDLAATRARQAARRTPVVVVTSTEYVPVPDYSYNRSSRSTDDLVGAFAFGAAAGMAASVVSALFSDEKKSRKR